MRPSAFCAAKSWRAAFSTLPMAVLSPVRTQRLFFWLRPSKNFCTSSGGIFESGLTISKHAAPAHAVGHLFQPGQRQDIFVARLAGGLEHLAQPVADQVVDLVLRRVVGQALQELGQVLLAVEVVAAFGRVVQIPGDLLQAPRRRPGSRTARAAARPGTRPSPRGSGPSPR